MMNGKSIMATASVAMRSPPNQLELLWFSPQWPGLVAGKLAHICERLAYVEFVLKSMHHGTFVRARQCMPAFGLAGLADGCSPTA